MDDLEIHDERQILPNSCFSIEPGIYLPEFGVRSEVNVLVRPKSAEVTGKIQREIVNHLMANSTSDKIETVRSNPRA